MTPEIEKATQECIKLKRDLTEAEQNYKLAQQAIEKPYKQMSEAIEKIHAQLNKLKEKEDELDEQLSKAHKKTTRSHRIYRKQLGVQNSTKLPNKHANKVP